MPRYIADSHPDAPRLDGLLGLDEAALTAHLDALDDATAQQLMLDLEARALGRVREKPITKETQRAIEMEAQGRMPELMRLVEVAWRAGVHIAATADGHLLVAGPDTPAAQSAVAALRPYAELLRKTWLLSLADQGVPPLPSVEAAQDYLVRAIVRDRADGGRGFLEMLGIAPAAVDGTGADRERGQ